MKMMDRFDEHEGWLQKTIQQAWAMMDGKAIGVQGRGASGF